MRDQPEFSGTRSPMRPREAAQALPLPITGGPWRVVVLNDPVNSMGYLVLRRIFGFDEETARRVMMEVHEQGRAVVWAGLREQAELYAFELQKWHLTAILESDETH
jgi:ATP-dependent Clp protease adaptor protein ClpS